MQKWTSALILTISCVVLFSKCIERKHTSRTKATTDATASLMATKYTEWFFQGKMDSLHAALNETGRKRFPTVQSFAAVRNDVISVLPGFRAHVKDSTTKTDTLVSIWHYGINSRDGAMYYIKWRLSAIENKIIGFSASDAGEVAQTKTTNYRSKTLLRLPFEGEWIVFWGGKTIEDNYHAAYPNQRFAMDLMPVQDSSKIIRAAKGETFQLADFAGFGADILAPADGIVVISIDTIYDNAVGTFHPTSQSGNHIIIDHRNGEYSYVAHLKQRSLTVKVGDKVRQGEKIGECGNSGRTTAPHLHYDLLNSIEVSGTTLSFPARFYNYYANSVLLDIGEPKKWQVIRNAALH